MRPFEILFHRLIHKHIKPVILESVKSVAIDMILVRMKVVPEATFGDSPLVEIKPKI